MQANSEMSTPDKTTKPHVARVVLPDGRVRLIGVTEAAQWLGCSRQALSQLARGKVFYAAGTLEARAREAFPAMFNNAQGE